MMTLGSNGEEVRKLQNFLGISADGIFGIETFATVKNWQTKNGLTPDGIVGPKTLSAMGLLDTNIIETSQYFEKKYLDKDEYFAGSTKKQWIFLHHTAGWHNPYNVVSDWNNDSRGKIATEFVVGGQSIKGDDEKFDGKIVQTMPHIFIIGINHCEILK